MLKVHKSKRKTKKELKKTALFLDVPEVKIAVDMFASDLGFELKNTKQVIENINRKISRSAAEHRLEIEELEQRLPGKTGDAVKETFGEFLSDQFEIQTLRQKKVIKSVKRATKRCLKEALEESMASLIEERIEEIIEEIIEERVQKGIERGLAPILKIFDQFVQVGAFNRIQLTTNIIEEPATKRQRIKPPKVPLPGYEAPEIRMLDEEVDVVALYDEYCITTPEKLSIKERDAKYPTDWRIPQISAHRRKTKVYNFILAIVKRLGIDDRHSRDAAELLDSYRQHLGINVRELYQRISTKQSESSVLNEVASFASATQQEQTNQDVA